MFDVRFRTDFERALRPLASNLRRAGINADHLTGLGVVMAVAAAIAIGNGALRAGLLLVALTAVPDLLDGAVAKVSGTASPRGAFFDSVSDRVTDALVLGGIGWYLASEHGDHMALLPFAVLGASALISYERAKAESLGYTAKGGLMERAERIIAICFGLTFSALLVPVLWVMLALTVATATHRFVKVWRQADPPPPARRTRPVRPAMEARWRAWRESTAARGNRPRRHAWGTRAGGRAARGERTWRRRAGTRP